MSDEIEKQLDKIFADHRAVLFINGTLTSPKDAASAMGRDLLVALKIDFHPVDVSADPRFMAAVQARSETPEMAQFFIDGQFFGPTMIIMNAVKSKQMDKILTDKNIAFDTAEAQKIRDLNK